ncbi:MAG: hypothetical protein R2704_07010 [Microthrixaceae bacterium]|nr:hypothetical protein [Microthrixaceae bacterium]
MAKPTKRRVDGEHSRRVTPKAGQSAPAKSGTKSAAAGDGAARSKPAKPGTGASEAKRASKRVTDHSESSRYTPPSHVDMPSPWWVPTLMWGFIGAGGLAIILNYAEVLPGTSNGANGWYLIGGLVAILAGIMTATQYR